MYQIEHQSECQGTVSVNGQSTDDPNSFSWSSWLHMGRKDGTSEGRGGQFPDCEHMNSSVSLIRTFQHAFMIC